MGGCRGGGQGIGSNRHWRLRVLGVHILLPGLCRRTHCCFPAGGSSAAAGEVAAKPKRTAASDHFKMLGIDFIERVLYYPLMTGQTVSAELNFSLRLPRARQQNPQ